MKGGQPVRGVDVGGDGARSEVVGHRRRPPVWAVRRPAAAAEVRFVGGTAAAGLGCSGRLAVC